jgi:hypothetical protein
VEYKRDSNHKGQIARTELVAGVTVQRVMVKIKVVQEIQGDQGAKITALQWLLASCVYYINACSCNSLRLYPPKSKTLGSGGRAGFQRGSVVPLFDA